MAEVGKERLKKLARLHEAKVRKDLDCLLIEGPRLVGEALAEGRLLELFVRDDAVRDTFVARAGKVPVRVVGEDGLAKLASVRTPQSVVGLGRRLPFQSIDEVLARGARFLLLDGVQDPGNVGTILRTGCALGVAGAILGPGTADPESPKVLRSSAGACFRMPMAKVQGVLEVIEACAARRIQVVLPVVEGGVSVQAIPTPTPFLLVAGNEGQGSGALVGEDLRVTIPMASGMESMNVAAAIAVLLGRWMP